MTITLPPAPTISARTIARRQEELLTELERMMGDDGHELYEPPGPGCGIGVDLHMKMVAEGTARRNASFDDDLDDDDYDDDESIDDETFERIQYERGHARFSEGEMQPISLSRISERIRLQGITCRAATEVA